METLLGLFIGTTILFLFGVVCHIKIYYGRKKSDKLFYRNMSLILDTMKNTVDKTIKEKN